MKIKVLFLCARNSVQSPIAEVLLNQIDSRHFEATSAGIDRGELHPLTIEVIREIGVDLNERTAKVASDIHEVKFDFVITLCDRARSECPAFRDAELVHWRFEDPLVELDPARQKRLFQALRDQLAQRIRLFALVQARPPQAATQRFSIGRPQPGAHS